MGIASNMRDQGGHKGARFAEVGAQIEGVIVGLREVQGKVWSTEILETWPNGDPKMTPVYSIQTEDQDEEDDDGIRDVWARGGLFTAIKQALQQAYPAGVEDQDLLGATLKVQFYDTKPGKGNPRKLYQAKLTPKAAAAEPGWVETPVKKTEVGDDIPF